ncbi:MAG: hypothetical protein MUC59_12230, partial [Saprospiraceae bacterium]|nr:hypothetical protein [Saprospiraceae bacterium]
PDEVDSDGVLSSSVPQIAVLTGAAGQNNHSYDFGFKTCPTITNPSAAQTVCAGGTGSNITVNTTTNTANSIRFVRFTTDQMVGATPTQAESAAIYAGTVISTVTPTGGASPFTATYVFNAADFPSSSSIYYVYAILNPDEGVGCRPAQEIIIRLNAVTGGTVGADQTRCSPADPAAFTVTTAATGSGTLSYQWQSSTTSCSEGFSNISLATGATYNAPSGLTQTTYYRRVTTSTLNGVPCTALSNCITVTVNTVSAGTVGSDQTICYGGNPAAFTTTTAASGAGTLFYQWQRSTTSCTAGFSNINGATSATYDPPSGLTETTYYRLLVSSSLNMLNCVATSNCVTVNVNRVFASLPGPELPVCTGSDPAPITVGASAPPGSVLTYQWKSSTAGCGGPFADIAGATAASYDPPAGITAAISYHVVVTSTLNGLVCSATSQCFTLLPVACTPCGAGDLGGTAWIDFDADGIRDASETEEFSGITVNVYDCNNNLAGTTVTDVNGQWSLNDNGFTYPLRVEFSGIPAGMSPAFNGNNSGTSVRFVSASSCNVDMGLMNPSDYCDTNNPKTALSCYEPGNAVYGATGNIGKGIISFPYNSTGPTPTGMSGVADIYEVGTVWGMGWQANNKRIFTSSLLKRHSGLGPAGIGGIYVLDFSSGADSVETSFTLQGVMPANGGPAIDLGSVNRIGVDNQLPDNNTASSYDIDAFGKIGKVSYGDADVSPDGNTLWVVNLNQRALITVDISSTTAYPGTVRQYLMSSATGLPSCSNGVLRPWGLGFRNGKGYLGCMCTGENNGTDADLWGYVLSFDPANPTAFEVAASFPLDYKRERGVDFTPYNLFGESKWRRWASTWAETGFSITPSSELVYAQPAISDIDFADDGAMILGISDLFGYQMGFQNFLPISGNVNLTTVDAAGDILRLCKKGDTWIMEGAPGCEVQDNATRSSMGDDGPSGRGEFFYADYFDDTNALPTYNHNETFIGAVGVLKGTNEVMAVHYDPSNGFNFAFDLGVLWHNTTTGARSDEFRIVESGPAQSKGNGLGDFEFICAAAPKQIGNYVWIDTDLDGVQDPCEAGVNGIKVNLYEMVAGVATLVATTTTATVNGLPGAYYFTDYQQYGTGYDTLKDNSLYYIVIGETGGTHNWSASNGNINIGGVDYLLTNPNAGIGATPDLNDSDAFVFTTAGQAFTNYPVTTVTIGGAGYVNHSLDFGLKICPTITNPSAAQSLCVGATGSNITVRTTSNATNGIRFVRFSTDQMAGSTPTPAEAATIYAGTAISTVTPTGGASPYTATYVFNSADFATAGTYFVYAILNPDNGAVCRPTQEIIVTVRLLPDFTLALATVCPGDAPEVIIAGLTNGTPATSTMSINTGAFVPYAASPPNLTTAQGIVPNTTNTVTVRNEHGCETQKNIAVPNTVPLACPPANVTKIPAGTN